MDSATANSSSATASTAKSASSVGEDVNLGEINFEELIKATNVTPRGSKTNSQDEGKPKSSETTPKTGGLTKIAPKPSLPTGVKTVGNSGQVVIIQSPAGTPLPIRITGTANNTQEKKGSPVTIQVLKMPDGRLVQIRNNKALNLTNLSNVTQVNVAGKKTTTSASNSTIIVKNTIPSALITSQAKLQTGITTVAPSVKQSSGESPVKASQKNVQDSSTANKVSNSLITTGTIKQITQKLVVQDKELRPKTDGDSNPKQIVIPQQHVLKLSPSISGPIQAIQIPGKPGLQYVRVLGTTGSTSTTKGSTILTGIRPKDASPTKMTVIPQVIGGQKIIMASKVRPTVSISSASKDAINIASQNVGKQHPRNVITTVPTLRKVDKSITKVTTIVKDEDDPISIESTDDDKISQLNEQIKKISENYSSNGPNSGTKTQHLMVPLELFRQMQSKEAHQLRLSSNASTRKLYSVLKPSPDSFNDNIGYPIKKRSPSPEGIPRRKHCNCTKSQCLKLYCDCFANGEFCQDCNCKDCYNNLEYEEERQKAIKICLERNPSAFKPKITKARDQSDLRLHNKGCNCKRSGCLKNYCECYEAKIACSSNCKCFGCRNVEDRSELDPLEVVKIAQNFGRGVATKRPYDEIAVRSSASSHYYSTSSKQNCNFITPDVVDASIQCMLAQADECVKNGIDSITTEKMIIEELGRCLVEIIDFSIRTTEH